MLAPREAGWPSHSWLLVQLVTSALAGCVFRPDSLRQSVVVQSINFDGAYSLSLHEGLGCLEKIVAPYAAVNQSLHAVADFYEQFYAFRYICADPAASDQVQAPPFNYGIYGTPRGGGASAEAARVDLVDELRALAASLPSKPGLTDWYLPANSIFARLRDSHVDWRNGGTKVDSILNQFIFMLQDDRAQKAVRIQVAARDTVVVNGFAAPRFLSEGGEIASIDGLQPMRWFRLHVLENPAFNYGFKSVGPRANSFLKLGRIGIAWLGSNVGDVSSMKPSVNVTFADGSACTWSWRWLWLTRNLASCKLFDAACAVKFLEAHLTNSSALFQHAAEAASQLSSRNADGRRSENVMKHSADADMVELLRKDPGLRTLLQIQEENVPGTEAHRRVLAHLGLRERAGQAVSLLALPPRRWLLNPAASPLGASYGYFEFQEDEGGKVFAVFKLSRLYVSSTGSVGYDAKMEFVSFWKELVYTAKERGVDRLLIDVAGNAGGFVDLAYLLVRALYPFLEFQQVCNTYDRPVGSLYKAWREVDTTPLAAFMDDDAAIRQRLKQMTPEEQAAMKTVLQKITKACMEMDVLDMDDVLQIQSAIDSLDTGEVDEESLRGTLEILTASAESFGNPFSLYLDGYAANGTPFDPFKSTRTARRGGKPNVKLTEFFRIEDCVLAFTQKFVDAFRGVEHPFTNIVFVSDGGCGSSCDTFSRTAYMIAKKQQHHGGSRLQINYVTFGGLGGSFDDAQRTLSATSFPGGNLMMAAMAQLYNPIYSAAALGYLAAEWAGLGPMKRQLAHFRTFVPQYPYYWNNLPQYPQSEMYQNALGDYALPAEFYFFPTDMYLPDWYADVVGEPHEWNESELRRLHVDAAKAFKAVSMILSPSAASRDLLGQQLSPGTVLKGTNFAWLVGLGVLASAALFLFVVLTLTKLPEGLRVDFSQPELHEHMVSDEEASA